MKTKRNWEMIPEEKKEKIIRDLIFFFEEERDERIGMIGAESILDFFLHTIGIEIYNQGVEDSITFIRTRFQEMELDMGSILLKK